MQSYEKKESNKKVSLGWKDGAFGGLTIHVPLTCHEVKKSPKIALLVKRPGVQNGAQTIIVPLLRGIIQLKAPEIIKQSYRS